MKEVDGWLIQISTDYVFGKEPYNIPCGPDQKGTPTGVYGKTKLHSEQKIIATGCIYIIIRTAWLYSEFGKNFCKTMINLTATKPALKVVFDQCGTPTYALDLAHVIITIIEKPQVGVFHFSNEGVCSWYDFTQMIAKIVGNNDCDIQSCYSSEYPSPVTPRYVKPGGTLMYSTCTLLYRENGEVVETFLAENNSYKAEAFPLPGPVGLVQGGSVTLWPQRHGTDGFFISKMRREEG